MEKKYINESMYKKKTSRKRRDGRTVRNNLNSKTNNTKKVVKNVKKPSKLKTKNKNKNKNSKTQNIVICIILLIIIAVISRAILKDENEPFIPFFFMSESNKEVIKIGVITEDNLLDGNTKNTIVNELNKYSKDMLLEVNEDYSITYKCVSNVTKVSNSEYAIKINSASTVTADNIKQQLENYRNNNSSVYYDKLKDIDSIQIVDDNTLNIKLKTDNAYFIYNLDICLTTSKDCVNYVLDEMSNANRLIFNRYKDANKELPLKIIVIKYKNMYAAVEAYKSKEIKMFVTNAENVQNILGRYEYNILTYRNGQNIFLFGNKDSELYQKEEVRKAIAYSIDRGDIITNVLKSKGTTIDLPYIYDKVKYKYDVYAAENLLLTNGYKKDNNKVYYKTENGRKVTLELELIVNKDDQVKVDTANKIKNNLNAIGIKINVEKLTDSKMQNRIKNGNYDLMLANINLNNSPDIAFVYDNLFITENISKASSNVKNSAIQELSNNIMLLQDALSQDISCIGIVSDVSYLIYSKDIMNIENISYMNIFKELLN